MNNINIKPTTLGISLAVFIIIITYIIYKYINNNMKNKLHRQKRKLKKYYETQFNQMFYNNQQNDNQLTDINQPPNTNQLNDINQPNDINEPDGIDSQISSSNDSDHADALDNPKILNNNYKDLGNEKMPRGRI